jgi:hypothetical protein
VNFHLNSRSIFGLLGLLGIVALGSALYMSPHQTQALVGTPTAAGATEDPKPKAWAAEVEACIVSAEAKSREFDKISTKLRQLGLEPSLNDLKKLVEYRRAELDLAGELNPIKNDLKRQLFELWKMTGNGRPILAYARKELLDHAPDVCKEYRGWLKQNGGKEFQEVISGELSATVDAVRTEYCWAGLDVLKKWVFFTSTGTRILRSEGSNYDVRFTLESRERAHRLIRNWYDSSQKEMKWNSELMRFVRKDDGRFEFPEIKLELEF